MTSKSCTGGPKTNPNSCAYVLAKKVSADETSLRKGERGGEDPDTAVAESSPSRGDASGDVAGDFCEPALLADGRAEPRSSRS